MTFLIFFTSIFCSVNFFKHFNPDKPDIVAKKYKNKFRIPSTRLPYWDYGWNAAYFVTICTQHREHFFGEVTNRKMQLSKIGELVSKYWVEIPQHFSFVILDAFIFMPDHFHGIIIIDKPDDVDNTNIKTPNVETPNLETPNLGVSTHSQWKPGTLGVIINQFKRICTKNARMINPNFAWQSRFYDHIIRNKDSFYKIVNYIHSNPQKWPK